MNPEYVEGPFIVAPVDDLPPPDGPRCPGVTALEILRRYMRLPADAADKPFIVEPG